MMIPVSRPYIAKNSVRYVTAALEKGAVSGLFGDDLPAFERAFADFIGVEHAISCANGTVALHLPLAASGIGPGDEVLVSTLTNMATIFAIIYCGATPVPVDVDISTLTVSVEDAARKVTPRTKAIIVVHLFGQPADMTGVGNIARRHGLAVYEDCAESHGASIGGRTTGAFGAAGCFSFFANKIINTGEGGIVTTNDGRLAEEMRSIRSLAFGRQNKFLHERVGFNYRMDNLKAALGRAQMEEAVTTVSSAIRMGQIYDELLRDETRLILPVSRPNVVNVYWMYHIRLDDTLAPHRDEILAKLFSLGVETRPGFVSYTLQPFRDDQVVAANPCPVAEAVSFSTFYLPSFHGIDRPTQEMVVDKLKRVLDEY